MTGMYDQGSLVLEGYILRYTHIHIYVSTLSKEFGKLNDSGGQIFLWCIRKVTLLLSNTRLLNFIPAAALPQILNLPKIVEDGEGPSTYIIGRQWWQRACPRLEVEPISSR